jgi:hypothetical protein
MPITCICPQCRKQLSIADEHAGQPMRCPMCTGMFQAPALYAAQMNAGYTGPAPFWQNQRSDPKAPEWPWLVGTPPPAGPAGRYDWEKVQNPSATLDPGWHLVRRGLGLMMPGLLIAFGATALGLIFHILANPDVAMISAGVGKTVLLLAIVAAALGSVGTLLGQGLCCAAPKESGVRLLAIGSALAAFVAVVAGMFALLLGARAPQAGGFLQDLLAVARLLGFVLAVLAGLGAGAAFLLFLRGTANAFGNQRLGQRLFYFLFGFGAMPVAALLLYLLIRAAAAIVGLDESGYLLILAFAELSLLATVLAGFLLLLRDVKATVERVVVPTRA